jgi:Domain of unknown function (DUF6471)
VTRHMSDTDRLAYRWINRLLRNEMITHGVTYPDLKRRLITIGVYESESALRSRVSRGKFSALFLFQCLKAIGSKIVDIELYDYILDPTMEEEADAPGGRKRSGRNHAASAGGGIETEPRCSCGAAAILVVTFSSSEKYFCAAHFPHPAESLSPAESSTNRWRPHATRA